MSTIPGVVGYTSLRQNSRATIPICPRCRNLMAFRRKEKILFTNGLADAVYRCEICRVDTKRTVKYP